MYHIGFLNLKCAYIDMSYPKCLTQNSDANVVKQDGLSIQPMIEGVNRQMDGMTKLIYHLTFFVCRRYITKYS